MMKSVTILGAGRVGRALGRRLKQLGWKICGVAARSEQSARKAVRFIGAGTAETRISRLALDAQTILLTVPDDALSGVARDLARVGGEELRGKIVLHTSGACDASVLKPLRVLGAAVGSMHPLQTFSGVNVPPLEGKAFAIEGDATAVRVARQMTRALGGIPVNIPSSKKVLYHAAGSFAAGLMLAVEEAGVQMLMEAGLRRPESVRALLSLTRQVLDHYEEFGAVRSWTGPLSRGDYGVIARHEKVLQALRPEFLEAYRAVNRLAARVLAREPGATLKALAQISTKLPATAESKGGTA